MTLYMYDLIYEKGFSNALGESVTEEGNGRSRYKVKIYQLREVAQPLRARGEFLGAKNTEIQAKTLL